MNDQLRLNQHNKFFETNKNTMPPLILYSVDDIKNNLNNKNKYHFNIPDISPFPDKDDNDFLDKLKLIYNYQITYSVYTFRI